MMVAVPTETYPGERRVALVPAAIAALKKLGCTILVQAGAGVAAGYSDAEYVDKGARTATDRSSLFEAEVIVQVRSLGANPVAGLADLPLCRSNQLIVGSCDPLGEPASIQQVAQTGASLMALELIPRITRAQAMDVLSSMATIAGYRAVLLAATSLPKMFPLMMTAAGTLSPARVLVIGAGVAGLQAIATARRLGAVVQAYDVRSAVREQVESLGGKFVELDLESGQAEDKQGYARQLDENFYRRQRELMAKIVADSDVVISTAAIPGKQSPLLVTADAVRGMRPGSVIVDLAAQRGGNCELTQADERVVAHGVTILGPTNLPAEVPYHASQMYSKNVQTLLQLLVKEGRLRLNRDDEIVSSTLVAHQGEVVHPRIRELLNLPPLQAADPPSIP